MNVQVEGAFSAPVSDPGTCSCRILIVGRDQKLLESRAWVMEKGGFAALISTDLDDAERTAAEDQVDVLMLCHSLTEPEARSIVRRARLSRPNVPIVLLTSFAPGFALDVESFDVRRGPRALLARCAQMFTIPSGYESRANSIYP